jgi:hypothetical protein
MHDPLTYPELPADPVPTELLTRFLPLLGERRWVQQHAHSPRRQLELLVLLKTFQFLGYFPTPEQVAATIVAAISQRIEIVAADSPFTIAPASLCRSRAMIRRYLGIER